MADEALIEHVFSFPPGTLIVGDSPKDSIVLQEQVNITLTLNEQSSGDKSALHLWGDVEPPDSLSQKNTTQTVMISGLKQALSKILLRRVQQELTENAIATDDQFLGISSPMLTVTPDPARPDVTRAIANAFQKMERTLETEAAQGLHFFLPSDAAAPSAKIAQRIGDAVKHFEVLDARGKPSNDSRSELILALYTALDPYTKAPRPLASPITTLHETLDRFRVYNKGEPASVQLLIQVKHAFEQTLGIHGAARSAAPNGKPA